MSDFDLTMIEDRLRPYVEEAGRLQGKDITIDRTLQLAAQAGNPQDRLRVVHVAGTSGKTSTSYYTAALLRVGGSKVGLTVSPHIDSIAERVQIDGLPLPETTFISYMMEFLELVEMAAERPTYFELMMVFALWVFDKEAVDYAVIETGLGGLHDSSNVCQRTDKLAVITDIGLDHMHVLGDTIEAIAHQKLGIVHPGNDIVMHHQMEAVMSIARQTAVDNQSELVLAKVSGTDGDLPLFQQRNWALARAVYDHLILRDELAVISPDQLADTQAVDVPGRMDVVQVGDKTVVLDGAHNQQKMETFLASFGDKFADTRPLVLLALKQGKDTQKIAPLIARLTDKVVVTGLEVTQDAPIASESPTVIETTLRSHGVNEVQVINDNQSALQHCLEQPNSHILIIGSLYLVASVRRLLSR